MEALLIAYLGPGLSGGVIAVVIGILLSLFLGLFSFFVGLWRKFTGMFKSKDDAGAAAEE